MEKLNRSLKVVTPEYVELEFETAGVGTRAGAQLIDVLILMAGNVLLFVILGRGSAWMSGLFGEADGYFVAAMAILFTLLNGGYFVIGEFLMNGQTVGKKVMGIRVIQEQGQSLTLLSALIRNFLRLIDFLPVFYFVGITVSFFHGTDKRLGDLAAGTVVVMEQRISHRAKARSERRIDGLRATWFDRMPAWSLEAAHKQAVEARDWRLLNTYVERLPYLSEKRSNELSRKVANHFYRKLALVEEQVKGLPAEVFLLHVHQQLRPEWDL